MRATTGKNSARFPAELGLAVACCGSCFGGASKESTIHVAGLDWERFVEIARFHRIEGLVWTSLTSKQVPVPDSAAEDLSSAAAAIAARNLLTATECHELTAQFEAAGVPLLFLKGLTLGALAYGNSALKSAVDIDLLIEPADLLKAAELLGKRGYQLVLPGRRAALQQWHSGSKESVWEKSAPEFQIDLHTRTADNPSLIPSIDVHSPRQSVKVDAAISLETFADRELFAYLAVHGASSAWFRLKWVADFAGFIHGRSGKELSDLYEASQQLGAGRAAGQALLLADRLFGSLAAAPALRETLAQDRSARILCAAAVRLLEGGKGEPTERLLGTLPIHWTQFLLLPGLSYKFSEFARQASAIGWR